jgi:DNA-directed RNA polymerase subunit H
MMPLALQKILEHYLVPKHEIVPEDRKDEVIRNYGAGSEKLPKIHKDDPVVDEIGAKKGDIIKITRKSPTAGKAISFRLVV